MTRLIAVLFLLLAAPAAAQPKAPAVPAQAAILVEFDTGAVLFARNADAGRPPASLTKLMTLEVVFHEMAQGRLRPDTTFTVSERAVRRGRPTPRASTMFLEAGMKVSVADLIAGLVVASGNDAALVIAEGVAGSEAAFVRRMNERAKAIGLTRSRFTNPHGFDSPEQRASMRDMARLAAHLVRAYPDRYPVFARRSFTFAGVTQHNRNPVLGMPGVDGLKTGQTQGAGFALVASARRDGRRLILALGGAGSEADREEAARALLDWGFSRPAAASR
ncbi:MAG TPA: D-alanyl-D-alanine carboxypeptidase family protein [Beijerinckiaceae bacterium]|nr:D-alanyl-D-alanine carboxypeptidase family protein [Beijerinckiaceae bacterium]